MREGWALLRACVRTVARDRELAVLPLLAVVPPVAIVLWCMAAVGLMELGVSGAVVALPLVLGTIAGLVAWAYSPLLAQAAIAAGALERFRGGDPTAGSALRAAWRQRGPLFWRLWETPRGADPQVAYLVAEGRPGPEEGPEPTQAEHELDSILTASYLVAVVPGFVLGGLALRGMAWLAGQVHATGAAFGAFIGVGVFAMVAGILWGIGLVGLVSNVAAAARYHRTRTGQDPLAPLAGPYAAL